MVSAQIPINPNELDILNTPSLQYNKTCVKQTLSKRPKMVFKTNHLLMQVKSIAECSKGSILQYFLPSLSYHLSLRSLFCLFYRGFIVLAKTSYLLYLGKLFHTVLRKSSIKIDISNFFMKTYVVGTH